MAERDGTDMGPLRAKLGEIVADADVSPSDFARLDSIFERLDAPAGDGFTISLRALCMSRLALAKAGIDERKR